MCGIAGFVGRGTKETLQKMTDVLSHRGPDDQGFFYKEGIGFGHRRLSIIDISNRGHQPMWDHTQQIAVIFNGEIYNFKSLRTQLERKGKHFKSDSDTEVIVELYCIYGEKCFEMLHGMFAIALYDRRKEKVVLARDRFGKKPLYWGIIDDTLIFGSELKALMGHPLFRKELDLVSVNKYLLYGYIPTPHSIFKDIQKLEPATYLVYEKRTVRKECFWTFSSEVNNISLKDACIELDHILDRSVSSRLIADVPLGIFLSGGLDSSTIAYYAQKNSRDKIQTFSIGFEERSFDESHFAQDVASYLCTDHHVEVLRSKDMLDLMPQITTFLDEPVADASFIPTYFLSKFTRQHVTVALGGDGGDELFAGYPTFQAVTWANLIAKVPHRVRENLFYLARTLIPTRDTNFHLAFKIDQFASGFESNKRYLHQQWLGSFGEAGRGKLFKREVWDTLASCNIFEDIDQYHEDIKIPDALNKLLAIYIRTYLMDNVLVKVDRASMAQSLEVRAPFLDHKLVDFVLSLPYAYKYKRFASKILLKQLMEDKLPSKIIKRKKKGFGIPLAKWLREDLQGWCHEVLSEAHINNVGLFDYQTIQALMDQHFSGRRDVHKQLWTLIVFQLWYDRWMS